MADDAYLADLRRDTADLGQRLRRMTPPEIAATVALKRRPEPDDDPAPQPAEPATPAHDPAVCGLDGPGITPTCPACVAADRAKSAVGEELSRICRRFEAADQRARSADTAPDRAAALTERDEAAGEFYAAEMGLADLLLTMFRVAVGHRPDALRMYMAELLRPELEPVLEAVARLEARR